MLEGGPGALGTQVTWAVLNTVSLADREIQNFGSNF